MTDEQKTDQPIKESVPEPKTLKDYIGLGFDDMRKTEGEKADATKDTKPVSKEGVTATAKTDKPCTDCGKDGEEKKKRQGKFIRFSKWMGKMFRFTARKNSSPLPKKDMIIPRRPRL